MNLSTFIDAWCGARLAELERRWHPIARGCLVGCAVFFALLTGVSLARDDSRSLRSELNEVTQELRLLAEELSP